MATWKNRESFMAGLGLTASSDFSIFPLLSSGHRTGGFDKAMND